MNHHFIWKKGIIFGVDDQSIAWKTTEGVHAAGGSFYLPMPRWRSVWEPSISWQKPLRLP